jgi:hypothetical protein
MKGNGHIVIIAGASCVGKTTLLKTLMSKDRTWLRDVAKIGAEDAPEMYEARDWNRQLPPSITTSTSLVHYELTRPLLMGLHCYDDDRALRRILSSGRSITIVTAWEPPAILRARAKARSHEIVWQLLRSRNLRRFKRRMKRRRTIRAVYAPDALWAMYRDWIAYCRNQCMDRHWTVRPSVPASLAECRGAHSDRPLWMQDECNAAWKTGRHSKRTAATFPQE